MKIVGTILFCMLLVTVSFGNVNAMEKGMSSAGNYNEKVKAKDTENLESSLSNPSPVNGEGGSKSCSIEIIWPKIGCLNIARTFSIPILWLQALNIGLIMLSDFYIKTEASGDIDCVEFEVCSAMGECWEGIDCSPPFEVIGYDLPSRFAYTITATAYYNDNLCDQDVEGPFAYSNML